MEDIYLMHINKQISILKKYKLKIDDYEFIEHMLKKENFYGILNSYKKPFLQNSNLAKSYFIDGTTFENIYALYEFDMELKSIFIKGIAKAESIIKSNIYRIFYIHHGDNAPLRLSNFEASLIDDPLKLNFINQKILENVTAKTDIAYYNNEYGIIPLWAIINTLNLEELLNFYLLMKSDEREEVARLADENLNKKEFTKYFNILIEVKNLCFQNIAIYNFNSQYKLNFIDAYSSFNYFPESRSNVFTIIIILRILLSNENFKDMYKNILIQLDYLDNSLKNLRVNKIYEKICEEFLGIPYGVELLNV